MAILDKISFNPKVSKRIVYSLVGLIMLSIITYFIWDFLLSANLIIKAGDPEAKIYELTEKNNKYENRLLAKGVLNKRFKPGVYSFLIEKDEKKTIQTVKLEALKNQEFLIDLKNVQTPDLVTKSNAIDIQATNNQLYFINKSLNRLEMFNLDQQRPVPYKTNQLIENTFSADWVGDKKALLRTTTGQVAFLDNQNVQFFNPSPQEPEPYEDNKYSVNVIDMNSKLNILSQQNNQIFFQENINTKPIELVSGLSSEDTNIALSNSNLYAYASLINEVDRKTHNFNYSINISKTNDKNYKKTIESSSNISILSWSPDSKKIVYYNQSGIFIYILETDESIHLLTRTPEKENVLSWVSNDEIIYFENNCLWKVNINTKTSYKISSDNNGKYITALAVSNDKTKIFYTISIPNIKGVNANIYKINNL